MAWSRRESPGELQSELELARGGRGIGDQSRGRGNGAGLRERGGQRQAEVGPVQDIEELGAELQVGALAHAKILKQRGIEREQARAFDDVASGIAVRARR